MPQRAIPAWAGKPCATFTSAAATAGHPRVGGETDAEALLLNAVAGPSPRGRGNRESIPAKYGKGGAIPAWAGKPLKKTI